MTTTNAAATYRRNAILTASPEKLVKMLYDGALRHMEQSRTALSTDGQAHSATVGESLSKAMGIIGELRTCLDHEVGGELSQNLDGLYNFCLDQLSDANISRQPSGVENSINVMRTLKEGWDAVIPA